MAARDWFWISLLGGIWGFSFIFNAVLIEEIGPLWVSALRVCIGALGCWLVLFALRKPLPRDPMVWIKLGALGLLAYSIPFALYPMAQGSLASGVAAIINALTPIMTVLISPLFRDGERATPQKIMGVVCGFAGVAILASPALSAGGTSQLWAIGACLGATICYAVSLNITRSFKHIEPTAFAVIALTGAGLTSLVVALIGEGVPTIALPQTWLAALGIGLIATTFTFMIMYRILPRIGATNFSTVTFIAPISAIIFGFILLGEIILPTHLLGMAAIFAGLLLIDGRIARRFRLWSR
ncbi:DMT family transporter [Pelagibacterium montanilacus]|uniref:DMT family transporter n=1 Tax=Pelagibacterium montanilacus TaxID=2185280 RepID=UPI000F8C3AC7|nr:DMT family transporter [Pelagibacterium montanilacus]